MQSNQIHDELIPVAQVQPRFGFGKTTAYTLLKEGKIRARKLGTRTLIDVQSVHDYFSSLPEYKPQS